jgi:hypothetical protein
VQELAFDLVGEARTGERFLQQRGRDFLAEFEGAGQREMLGSQ